MSACVNLGVKLRCNLNAGKANPNPETVTLTPILTLYEFVTENSFRSNRAPKFQLDLNFLDFKPTLELDNTVVD